MDISILVGLSMQNRFNGNQPESTISWKYWWMMLTLIMSEPGGCGFHPTINHPYFARNGDFKHHQLTPLFGALGWFHGCAYPSDICWPSLFRTLISACSFAHVQAIFHRQLEFPNCRVGTILPHDLLILLVIPTIRKSNLALEHPSFVDDVDEHLDHIRLHYSQLETSIYRWFSLVTFCQRLFPTNTISINSGGSLEHLGEAFRHLGEIAK